MVKDQPMITRSRTSNINLFFDLVGLTPLTTLLIDLKLHFEDQTFFNVSLLLLTDTIHTVDHRNI